MMNKLIFFALTLAILMTGCASNPSVPNNSTGQIQTTYTSAEQLQSGAQAIVNDFAAGVDRVRGGKPLIAPTVEVKNTPELISYHEDSNRITVPWWATQPAEMRAVFRRFSVGTDIEAEQFFNAFFNGFIIAHEAAHWFQSKANQSEPTLYSNENQANRIAVAYWRTKPGGDQFLAHLEELANRAAASVPNPTPPGEDPVAYFGANYQLLAEDPLKYGYYQFRFMADAIHNRSQLDFVEMVGAPRRH